LSAAPSLHLDHVREERLVTEIDEVVRHFGFKLNDTEFCKFPYEILAQTYGFSFCSKMDLVEVTSTHSTHVMDLSWFSLVRPGHLSLTCLSAEAQRVRWIVAPFVREDKEFSAREALVVWASRVTLAVGVSGVPHCAGLPAAMAIWSDIRSSGQDRRKMKRHVS